MLSNTRTSGVTLLEVMLVLAVGAMILVMSVRYYQSASAGQQFNSVLEQIHAITSIADGIHQGTNSYDTVGTSVIKPLMPNKTMNTAWGGTIDINTSKSDYNSYVVVFDQVPKSVCKQLETTLQSSSYFTNAKCDTSKQTFSYTYDSGIL